MKRSFRFVKGKKVRKEGRKQFEIIVFRSHTTLKKQLLGWITEQSILSRFKTLPVHFICKRKRKENEICLTVTMSCFISRISGVKTNERTNTVNC